MAFLFLKFINFQYLTNFFLIILLDKTVPVDEILYKVYLEIF